jgi:hypothetical protein
MLLVTPCESGSSSPADSPVNVNGDLAKPDSSSAPEAAPIMPPEPAAVSDENAAAAPIAPPEPAAASDTGIEAHAECDGVAVPASARTSLLQRICVRIGGTAASADLALTGVGLHLCRIDAPSIEAATDASASGAFTVLAVDPAGPAALAGVIPGDVLTEVTTTEGPGEMEAWERVSGWSEARLRAAIAAAVRSCCLQGQTWGLAFERRLTE